MPLFFLAADRYNPRTVGLTYRSPTEACRILRRDVLEATRQQGRGATNPQKGTDYGWASEAI